jgi:hypothetical protein
MTKRTEHGYQHIHAYRTWLPEHDELITAVAKGASTSLDQTVSVEVMATCLGRSTSAILKRAQKLGVALMTQEQIDAERAEDERVAQEFLDRYI